MKQFFLIVIASILLMAKASSAIQQQPPRVKYPWKKSYTFRLSFRDKRGCGYTLAKPWQFLSRKSIDRRQRQGLPVDSTDLPVSVEYLRPLSYEDVNIIGMSKWNNTVLVNCTDTNVIGRLRRLPFVVRCAKVWESPDSITPLFKRKRKSRYGFNRWDSVPGMTYGKADTQLAMVGGHPLHQQGFHGEGMTVAVLDGGFENTDVIPVFRQAKIAGHHDFVYPPSGNFFRETDHGTKVLSVMAVNAPGVFIGTAPAASYWLLRCEDQQSEQPVEEDYWAMAAEYADSVGADIINSSLGYNEFDRHYGDHHYSEMDGHATPISHAASMLAGKGIILVNSAGNTGMGTWKKIAFPADADDILTVGAVTPTRDNAPFSGVGDTRDGRVKPDLMALGSPATMVSARGTVIEDMGTSFAAPIVCGMVACLWQALPQLTARQIIALCRRSGDNASHPDNIFGYGIPDFGKAWEAGRQMHSSWKDKKDTPSIPSSN